MAVSHRVTPEQAPALLELLLTLLTAANVSEEVTPDHPFLKALRKSPLDTRRAMAPNHTSDVMFESMHPVYANDSTNASFFLVHGVSGAGLGGNGGSGLGIGLGDGGGALAEEEGNHTFERRGRFNLTHLDFDFDLSPVFPSLEAVSEDVQVFLIVAYSLAAVLSLVGNITVILVLAFGRRSSVRCYLINLAVSDITMATFCIPFSYTSFMFHRWIFAPEFCRIVAFMQHVSVTCSVYTLVAIGVDRYKALIHPLNTRWTKSRARLVIGGIWVFSVVISLVPLIVSDSVRYDWDGEWYYECKENWPKTQDELYEKTYTVLLFIFTFVLPVVGLGYTYLSIVGMMCSYRMPGNAEPFRDQQQFLAKVKVINMMIAVMVCFVLSWFPLQVLQFLIYFAPDITQCRGRECFAYYMSFFTCHWIAMANSFMNPFIYCFMSKNFREDLCQFVRKCGRKGIRRQRSNPWSRGELGSSFRSILNITHKTSVQSSSKMSFRGKSDKNRELETLELRPIQDGQFLGLRRSRKGPPGLSSSLTPPATHKGKAGEAEERRD
ncbi:prolactin-releasing peptide receptor-like [Penaeus vannamei]|uniref:prolactin-releasing peptide receptor-like n=1 Tax=Penaeus vannamei TaxID=6689 RepID=UPI00387F4875